MNILPKTIFTGDNLPILRGINSDSVDLIYLDPPFNSNANYAAPIGSKAAGAEFKDTWTLNDVDAAWLDLIETKHPALNRVIHAAMTNSDKSYLIYMAVRLLEMHRVLKTTGSIYLHCDPTMSHYLKLLLDAVFGRKQFRNEIVWQRASGRAKGSQYESKSFGRDVDNILHFSKSDGFLHNSATIPLTPEEIEKKFPLIDINGRRYNTNTPIFGQPSMGARPNLCYEYKGVRNPHPSGWRVSKGKLIELDKAGYIIWRKGKRPLRKAYLDEYKGKPIGSLWIDIANLTGSNKERVGYPTQKPLALLDRIIKASSNQHDIVLDPFCGCATTLVAADRLQRNWIGIDISPKAAELVVDRIKTDQGLFESIIHRTDIPMRDDLGDIPSYNSRQNKETLYGGQAGNCAGCGEHFRIQNLEVDHIIAVSVGGTDHIDNLQLLCSHCNRVKGDRGQEYLLMKLGND